MKFANRIFINDRPEELEEHLFFRDCGIRHLRNIYTGQEFLVNPLSGVKEPTEITDSLLFSMHNRLNKSMKMSYSTFKRFFNDASFIESINPIQDTLEKLETSNSSQFNQLISAIQTTNLSPERVAFYLKTWMTGVLDCVFNHTFNKYILLLTGSTNIGKTFFLRNRFLSPFQSDGLVCNTFDWSDNKDNLLRLSRYLFIMDDEFSAGTKKDMEKIKRLTSEDTIHVRKAYGRNEQTYGRIASFCGTSNNHEIYDDLTGGIRFFVIELKDLKRNLINKIDYGKVWGYIYHEWKNGKHLSDYEKDPLMAVHKTEMDDHRIKSVEEELIARYVQPDETGRMSGSDILAKVSKLSKRKFNSKFTLTKLGLVMQKMGIERKLDRKTGKKITFYKVRISDKPTE